MGVYNEAFPNPEKKLNCKQYKTLFESLKNKSKKNYYSDIIDSYKYDIKKTWDIIKEIIGNKRVTNDSLSNFITVKNIEIFDKKEVAETFNNYFVNSVPNKVHPFPKAKRHSKTIFTTTFLASVPSIFQT